jgi:glycosyltransferase involved in cell wall biosynthesis
LPAAAKTLLSIDYPNLEIILINDRSDDGTGAINDDRGIGELDLDGGPTRWGPLAWNPL